MTDHERGSFFSGKAANSPDSLFQVIDQAMPSSYFWIIIHTPGEKTDIPFARVNPTGAGNIPGTIAITRTVAGFFLQGFFKQSNT